MVGEARIERAWFKAGCFTDICPFQWNISPKTGCRVGLAPTSLSLITGAALIIKLNCVLSFQCISMIENGGNKGV